jgi:hypothetical protein
MGMFSYELQKYFDNISQIATFRYIKWRWAFPCIPMPPGLFRLFRPYLSRAPGYDFSLYDVGDCLSLPEMIILLKVLKPCLIDTSLGVVGTGILIVGYLFNFCF